jgi:hypothetical protein
MKIKLAALFFCCCLTLNCAPKEEVKKISISAVDLVKEFVTDEKAATEKYKEKTIKVTGVVSRVADAPGSRSVWIRGFDKKNPDIIYVQCILLGADAIDRYTYGVGNEVTLNGSNPERSKNLDGTHVVAVTRCRS